MQHRHSLRECGGLRYYRLLLEGQRLQPSAQIYQSEKASLLAIATRFLKLLEHDLFELLPAVPKRMRQQQQPSHLQQYKSAKRELLEIKHSGS
jgi:hypothetical protein